MPDPHPDLEREARRDMPAVAALYVEDYLTDRGALARAYLVTHTALAAAEQRIEELEKHAKKLMDVASRAECGCGRLATGHPAPGYGGSFGMGLCERCYTLDNARAALDKSAERER